jgi:hypothetical protein
LGWLVGFSFLGLFFSGGCFPFLGFLKHVPQWYEGHKGKRSFGLSIFFEQNL